MTRHKSLDWAEIQAKLEASSDKMWSLNEMERTGGEPDIVGHDSKMGEYIFYDCSAENPKTAEVFVTIIRRRNQGKKIYRRMTPLIWLPLHPIKTSF